MTGSLEIFARLSELNVGDAVKLDAGFDCGIAGKTLVVDEDDRGLFVACDEGRHYLDGQLADDGDHLVGVYPVEGETVEVWSTQTPALNGTLMVVSTVAEADPFELIVADLLPDDDDADEEPGAMCKRALDRATERVDLVRQVAILVSGADDGEDFERTYGDEDQASIRATAREIIKLVRATPAPGYQGWLPIESAPRDGTHCLFYWPNIPASAKRMGASLTAFRGIDIGWWDEDEEFENRPKGWKSPRCGFRMEGDEALASNQEDCLFWMPLPATEEVL